MVQTYFYDTVGELRFGVNWISNAMSRVTLHVMQQLPDGTETEITTGPPAEAMAALFGGESGQSQMLAAFGTHLSVPGEAYLIGEPAQMDEDGMLVSDDQWLVASTEEVSERAGKWMLDRGDGKRPLAEESLIIRIWRSHPRQWVLADSSVRAVLPVLREIEALTKHVGAAVDSRLAGAGVFMVPSEMTFSSPVAPGEDESGVVNVGTEASPTDLEADPFLAALTEAMLTPIADRENAAAIVPIVVRAPGAFIGDAKHITFSTPLDQAAQELRAEAIRRLALGMDLPPEVLLGQADSNHWSAWQIEESALKVHIEPLCELLTAALTEQFLRPAMNADPSYPGDADTLHVFASTEDLRLRPDHSSQAVELYDRFELSGDALRRETGFDPEDAPTEEETRTLLLRKIAAAASPEQAAEAARQLGLSLPAPAPAEGGNVVALPTPTPPAGPSGGGRPIPQQAALVAAGEVLVLRALERANNRLNRRGNGNRRRPVLPDDCDLALSDAWDHAPRVASVLGVDPDWLTTCLDGYTRRLLTSGHDHTPVQLAGCLEDGHG